MSDIIWLIQALDKTQVMIISEDRVALRQDLISKSLDSMREDLV